MQPRCVQFGHYRLRFGANRIADRNRAENRSIASHVQHRLRFPHDNIADRVYERRIPDRNARTTDVPTYATTRFGTNVGGVWDRHATHFRSANDGLPERVFAAALDGCRKCKQFVFVSEWRREYDRFDFGFALRQRAGFVEQERIDGAQPLECGRVAEQNPASRARPDADDHRHRRGQPEGTWAGDD